VHLPVPGIADDLRKQLEHADDHHERTEKAPADQQRPRDNRFDEMRSPPKKVSPHSVRRCAAQKVRAQLFEPPSGADAELGALHPLVEDVRRTVARRRLDTE